jgi:outer membrane murein-binding lipoprotein Lpp
MNEQVVSIFVAAACAVGGVLFFFAGFYSAKAKKVAELNKPTDMEASSVELSDRVHQLTQALNAERNRVRELEEEAAQGGAKRPKFPVHSKFAE